jgi:hypothetical protein
VKRHQGGTNSDSPLPRIFVFCHFAFCFKVRSVGLNLNSDPILVEGLEEAGSVQGCHCLELFEECFSFSALTNQYDNFMITSQTILVILCWVQCYSSKQLTCAASDSTIFSVGQI